MTAPNYKKLVATRRTVQLMLWPIVVIVIAFGWRYPWLGYSVPVVMLMGMIGGVMRGRYVCGHLCPRGAFFDRIMPGLSRKRTIPSWLRSPWFRWPVFAALMAFMVYRIAQNPTDFNHWGRVFWLMCTVTTAIGVVLAVFIHPRAWCTFCPMGTMQSALDRGQHRIVIDAEKCIECRACEKTCPMNLAIIGHKTEGTVADHDCLRCCQCCSVCPKQALQQA